MKNKYTRHAEVTKCNHLENGFGKRVLATLWSLCQPASHHHVGMFAGSLLPYASWAQPKVPHWVDRFIKSGIHREPGRHPREVQFCTKRGENFHWSQCIEPRRFCCHRNSAANPKSICVYTASTEWKWPCHCLLQCADVCVLCQGWQLPTKEPQQAVWTIWKLLS